MWEDGETSSPFPSEWLEVGAEQCVACIVGECLHIRVCIDRVGGDDVGGAKVCVEHALQAGRRCAVAVLRMAMQEFRGFFLEGARLQGFV